MNPRSRFQGAALRRQTMIDIYDGDYAAERCDITNVSAQSRMEKL